MAVRPAVARAVVTRVGVEEANEAGPKGPRRGVVHATPRPVLLRLLAAIPNGPVVADLAVAVRVEVVPVGTIVATIGLAAIVVARVVLLGDEAEAPRVAGLATTVAVGPRGTMDAAAKGHPPLPVPRPTGEVVLEVLHAPIARAVPRPETAGGRHSRLGS